MHPECAPPQPTDTMESPRRGTTNSEVITLGTNKASVFPCPRRPSAPLPHEYTCDDSAQATANEDARIEAAQPSAMFAYRRALSNVSCHKQSERCDWRIQSALEQAQCVETGSPSGTENHPLHDQRGRQQSRNETTRAHDEFPGQHTHQYSSPQRAACNLLNGGWFMVGTRCKRRQVDFNKRCGAADGLRSRRRRLPKLIKKVFSSNSNHGVDH